MNTRIKNIRQVSLDAINTISVERARLLTEFYKSSEINGKSIPMQRALAFKYILEKKELHITDGELIVGERGHSPKATPTYPEVCLHTLDDLKILNEREKVSFKSSNNVVDTYEKEIIPFWKGKSIREKIMNEMDEEWKNAYSAGIFTEFQEQRAPGHTVAGNKIYKKGMLDIIKDIQESLEILDFQNDKEAPQKREQLLAMRTAAEALIIFAKRYSQKLLKLAEEQKDAVRRAELIEMAEICKIVPAHAPKTFHQALQYYWFVHVGVITELNPWDSFNPGRLDQHLYPFFKKEIEEGSLTKERAKEILQSFWVKFNNHPAPPKVGVTALESNTYTDFALINLGGLKKDGSDAVNDLSFIILDVIEEMRLLQPSSMVQISKKNPDSFIKRTLEITKTGFGQPSYFNTDAIIQELIRQGKDLIDARNGGASGCVETGAFGTESYILTGYFNLNKILELTLNNGVDPLTDKLVGIQTGEISSFKSFEDLLLAYRDQLNYFIDIKIKGSNIIESIYAHYLPAPFLSLVIDDCIVNARDYNAGGARYNTNYIQGVGLGTITDSLTTIKYHVFDNKDIALSDFVDVLKSNYKDQKDFRYQIIYETPKWGNDNDYADAQAVSIFNMFYDAVNGRPSPRGGTYRINMLPTTSHVYFGSKLGATADGRLAREPISEGISPVQGADTIGPTGVIKSASKIDQLRTGGTLLNQKFNPSIFNNESNIEKIKDLIRAYFSLDGHHIQFNVVTAETLKKAQKNPEKYKDLIVRVAGYSDYFNDLGDDLQNEIIRRTEHNEL